MFLAAFPFTIPLWIVFCVSLGEDTTTRGVVNGDWPPALLPCDAHDVGTPVTLASFVSPAVVKLAALDNDFTSCTVINGLTTNVAVLLFDTLSSAATTFDATISVCWLLTLKGDWLVAEHEGSFVCASAAWRSWFAVGSVVSSSDIAACVTAVTRVSAPFVGCPVDAMGACCTRHDTFGCPLEYATVVSASAVAVLSPTDGPLTWWKVPRETAVVPAGRGDQGYSFMLALFALVAATAPPSWPASRSAVVMGTSSNLSLEP